MLARGMDPLNVDETIAAIRRSLPQVPVVVASPLITLVSDCWAAFRVEGL